MNPTEQFQEMQRLKAEMLRSRNAQNKDQKGTELSRDELKYANLGIELE